MSRALLVEGSAALALDGATVGTVVGEGETIALDTPGLLPAWRLFRGLGPSSSRSERIAGLTEISRASGVRFEVRVRGRRIAHLEPERTRAVRLSVRALLRSLLPG